MGAIHHFIERVLGTPLGTLALIVTIAVGLLSIIKDASKLIAGVSHRTRSFRYGRVERAIFEHMQRHGFSTLHTVKTIANAVHQRPQRVHECLTRLEQQQKVRRMSVDEEPLGLWGIHEYEE